MIDSSDHRSDHTDNSAQPTTDSGWTEQLNLGLAALQQRQYQSALDCLLPLRRMPISALRLKAEMGLVQAYAGLGQVDQASEICRALANHSNPKLQRWAQQRLARLTNHRVRADHSAAGVPMVSPNPDVDPSGFIPVPGPPESSIESAGLPPITAPASINQPLSQADLIPQAPIEETPQPSPQTNPDSSSLAQSDHLPASLFHYQRLNQWTPDSDMDSVPSPQGNPRPAASLRPPRSLSIYKPPVRQLWISGLLTVGAVLWVIRWGIQHGLRQINWLLKAIDWPISLSAIPAFYQDHTLLILAVIVLLLLTSPWLLDQFFRWTYGQQPLTTRQLKQHSPDAVRIMLRVCQQRGWDLPELRLLPIHAPLCFSYGWLPRNARIVVSQGILDEFATEELACLYSYQLSHLIDWDLPLTTLVTLPLILFHQGYWALALWGNRQQQPILRGLIGIGANGLYLIFWIFRKLGLWFSRTRSQCGDVISLSLTSSPLAHQQTLIHLTETVARHITQTGFTHPLLESLDGLLAVSPQLALSLGSAAPTLSWAKITAWDQYNPYRQWLRWDTPHALLGERLSALQRQAQASGLPDLPLQEPGHAGVNYRPPDPATYLRHLCLQGAAIAGGVVGLAMAMLFWFGGGIVNRFNWWRLSWIYQDVSVLKGMVLLGLGIGIMVRVNRLFPDLSARMVPTATAPDSLLQDPDCLPIDGHPIALTGQLLGRPGLANWLCQDMLLRLEAGTFKLHFISMLGPLGNLFWGRRHPVHWQHQSVQVRGWGRRSTSLWIDVLTMSTSGRIFALSQHPQWILLLSLAISLWGVLVIFRG